MNEVFPVPVVIKNSDGSCMVALPDGVNLVTMKLAGAEQVVAQFLGELDHDDEFRIGFIPALKRATQVSQ